MKRLGLPQKPFFKEKKNFISWISLALTFIPACAVILSMVDSSMPLYGSLTLAIFVTPVIWVIFAAVLTYLLIYLWFEKNSSPERKKTILLNNIISSFIPFVILGIILNIWSAIEQLIGY